MSIQSQDSSAPELSPPAEELAASPPVERPGLDAWLGARLDLIALLVIAVGCVVRVLAAAASYLNPDEALHYLLANQPSAVLAYQASLTSAHPPFYYFLLLHFWRLLGNSEFTLRLPSVLAGTALLWVAFRWIGGSFGKTAGLIGLFLLTFSPALISLSAEVRGYAVLLLCMTSALYCLERAFEEESTCMIAVFSLFLYLAILTEYAAFWFTLALGMYVLVVARRLPASVVKVWVGFQVGAVALYAMLYMTHVSKLRGGAMEQEAVGGWLRASYFESSTDSLLLFPLRQSVAVFQYLYAQPAAGTAMLLVFLIGFVSLLARRVPVGQQAKRRDLGILLLLPFVLNCAAAIAGVYPYGGTRHSVFLALFATAGVSVLPARLAGRRIWPILVAAIVVVAVWILKAPAPAQSIDPQHQRRVLMTTAVNYIRQSVPPGSLLFGDLQTSRMLSYYLGRDQRLRFDEPQKDFFEFPYGGYRVVSSKVWLFDVESFATELRQLRRAYGLEPGEMVWVVSAGWGVNLYPQLTRRFPGVYFPGLMFGGSLSVFQVPAALERSTFNGKDTIPSSIKRKVDMTWQSDPAVPSSSKY